MTLTPEQEQAVHADGDRILLLAPAGSGKTEVLIQRIMRLLAQSRGQSHRILAVTYTVKAAENLRARITAALADEAWRVDAETLHGFALDWLRRYGEVVGIGPDVVVYSDDRHRIALIDGYLRSLLGPASTIAAGELRTLLDEFDDRRTRRPEHANGNDRVAGIPVAELYDGYIAALDHEGGIDFPGMLTKLNDALDADDWLGRHFRSLYRHVLVDEGQDLTPVQAQLLEKLVDGEVDVFVVADDRQSINGFAGGSFDNARKLVERAQAPVTLRLHHSLRCSTRILEAAERVAAQLATRPSIARPAAGAPPGSIVVGECDDVQHEATVVADWAQALVVSGLDRDVLAAGEDPAVYPEDLAIVGRSRRLLDGAVAELERRGVELAMQVEASDFLETPEGRIMHGALALEANAKDVPARSRIVEELEALSVTWRADLLSTIEAADLGSLDPIAGSIRRYRESADIGDLFDGLAAAPPDWELDAQRLTTLWLSYRAGTSVQDRSIAGFLRDVARVQRSRPSDPGIRVMTIHRVKGLEFKAVAVVGAYEGALPDYRAQSSQELDAERRSFYVAMTRAARSLHLTWPRVTRDRYGRSHRQSPSRFLREAELVE